MSETVTSRKGITWREPAVIALETLRTHKLRSFLTLLGVILSVATLIVVISMIRGTDQYISDKVANFGANVFLVSQFPYVVTREELVRLQRRNKPILWDDYQYLQQNMSTAKAVSYEMVRGTAVARYANLDIKDVLLDGVTPNLAEMGKVEPALGRYISDADNEHRAEVALIGDDVAKRFFLGVDPLGKTISVDGRPYQVIGVAKPLGSSFGFSQDKFVYIPVLTYRKIYGTQQSGTMKVQARGPQWMAIAQDEARMLMRSLRHVKPNEDDNFELIEPSSLMGLWSALTDTIAHSAVGIVLIFLLIGGIVIMNIMLASVTERTREIGVRKSLGATRKDIMLQFVIESSVLAAVGGVVGVGVALIVALILGRATSVPVSVPAYAIAMALTVSTVVGLVFGIYPARKAAKLDPIEALRYET